MMSRRQMARQISALAVTSALAAAALLGTATTATAHTTPKSNEPTHQPQTSTPHPTPPDGQPSPGDLSPEELFRWFNRAIELCQSNPEFDPHCGEDLERLLGLRLSFENLGSCVVQVAGRDFSCLAFLVAGPFITPWSDRNLSAPGGNPL
ncbi:hypothetical protein ACWDZW_27515 [Streptomyces coeruleorubidus]